MSRYLSFSSVILLLLLVSCQKETSFEQGKTSKGSLQGAFGDCLAKTVGGTYTATKSLGDSNYIDVTVDVAATGSYNVYTDTLNGYFFRASGNFTTVGSNVVRMKGFGTPGSATTNDFTVFYDSSLCAVSVTVLPNSGSSGGTAIYTLQGSGSSCMNATPSGTFTQGVALTSSNKINIQVSVTSTGTWALTTTTVDGFSFSGSGTFTTTGVQTITLTGSGTPTASGSQTFPIAVGSSSCSFVILVQGGAASTDHFILTDNSWWSYSTPVASDTLKRQILPGTFTVNGISYKGMKEFDAARQFVDDTLFFRKSGSNYYEINFVDYYTSFYLDNSGVDSILFLKEGLTTGATWSSPVYTGTENGANRKIRYDFNCISNNASVTLNGKTYNNVYQVGLKVMVDEGSGYVIDVTYTNYYAQGIGWIYQKIDYGGGSVFEFQIKNYQVF